ncbi:deoxyribose-phosphate aldolase [candidate division KSB1 bacterium]
MSRDKRITVSIIASMVDSTLLKKDASVNEIQRMCGHAVNNGVGAICVYPEHMHAAYDQIEETPVKLIGVVGFPHGTGSIKDKCLSAERRMLDGADELDMVMNLELFLDRRYKPVLRDIEAVIDAARSNPSRRGLADKTVVKVIIESALLEDEGKRLDLPDGILINDAAKIVGDAGGDFVKTSTGMHPSGGVRKGHVALIKSVISGEVGVKASGGIRTWDHVKELLIEGAMRFGTSSAEIILEELAREIGDEAFIEL